MSVREADLRQDLRQDLVAVCRRMNALGVNQGTSGNASARLPDGSGILVTPSSLPYDAMGPEDIVRMAPDGSWEEGGDNGRRPTSEWRFHLDILNARPDVNAIVHTHGVYATTLAVLHRDIPPFHYMVAVCGGHDIRCAPYATFGTQELSDHALAALDGRLACLLANHGAIVLGSSPEDALARTVEVETLARQYWQALQVGEPVLLPIEEIERVQDRMRRMKYGESPDT
ncbi:MAG: class II aldolase/adducin family protein [Alphaproteobacteria bacterium]|nr:class II aldolase/adducin family protein [Alphaproteobacteria bacterium]